MSRIAALAGVSALVVKRWLTEAGVTLRTRSEVIKAEHVIHGASKRLAVSQAISETNRKLAPTRSATHLHKKSVARKISASRLKQDAVKREAMIQTVYCEWCQEELSRLPCKVKERNFCNRNHMMKYRHSENRAMRIPEGKKPMQHTTNEATTMNIEQPDPATPQHSPVQISSPQINQGASMPLGWVTVMVHIIIAQVCREWEAE